MKKKNKPNDVINGDAAPSDAVQKDAALDAHLMHHNAASAGFWNQQPSDQVPWRRTYNKRPNVYN